MNNHSDDRTRAKASAGPKLLAAAQPSFMIYWRIARRWYKSIIGTFAAFVIAGLIVTLLMTRQYTAVATLEIARESNNIVQIQGVQRDATEQDLEFYQTQYGLLQSRKLSERVADRLGVVNDRKFFEMFGERADSQLFPSGNASLSTTAIADRRTRAGQILLKYLAVSPVRLSRLVNISFTSPDAALSARIVNTWTTEFVTITLERRFEATSYARKFLEGRLTQLRQRLEDSERQLVVYAANQRIINVPGTAGNGAAAADRSIVAENLAALNTERAAATADRIRAESRLRSFPGGASTEALQNTAIGGLRQKRAELAAEYKKLMTQFEPGYPGAVAIKAQIDQLDASITQEEGRVSSSFSNAYRDSARRETELDVKVKSLENGLLDLRSRSIQYNIFQRDVDTNRQLYDGLLQRYKEIGVAGGVGVNNISIVDTAETPDRPSSPRLLLNLVLSLILGAIASTGLALLLEQTDEAIMDPATIEDDLGLLLLGSVPPSGDVAPEVAILDRKSDLVDAYLSIQTNLRFTTPDGVPRTFSVTSTRAGEGKSTSALALATLLARAGRSVVLVDGDMRSPSVHELLALDNTYGLSDFLTRREKLEALLRQSEILGISVVTAGQSPPNAAELLAGDRFDVFVDEVSRRFDHVIIDSPPVLGLADAPLIGSKVDGVIYAVEAHGTKMSRVRIGINRLRSANVVILGCVLTKFEVGKANFGSGYEYGYGYGSKSG